MLKKLIQLATAPARSRMTGSDHQRHAKRSERKARLRLPRDRRVDSTAALLTKPYGYVRDTCAWLGSDLFRARLLLRRTICMRGSEAAELFYDESRFKRRGAAQLPAAAPCGRGDEFAEQLAQEVRRFYPSFPAVMAKARRNFSWKGISFPKGLRVLLDLHATNLSST